MSSINPNNIDGTYPIAGQDNDSQGFRDNFTNIKNNLQFALDELEDLQLNAVLKAPLGSAGQTTTDNSLNYETLSEARLIKSVETDSGNVDISSYSSIVINWENGHHQQLPLTENATISSFTNWPDSGLHTFVRLRVLVANTSATLTLPSTITTGINKLANANVTTRTISFSAFDQQNGNLRVYEFSTWNAGTSILVVPIYQPY